MAAATRCYFATHVDLGSLLALQRAIETYIAHRPELKMELTSKRTLEHAARESYRTAIALTVKLYFRHRGFNHVSAVAEADAAKDKDSVAESQCWGSKVA